MEFCVQRTPTARKVHLCNECQRSIYRGRRYHNSVIKTDDIYTYKAHLECREAALAVSKHFDWPGEDDTIPFILDVMADYREEIMEILKTDFPNTYLRFGGE